MNNERGIALPMALIVMVILTALMAAFAVLVTSGRVPEYLEALSRFQIP